MNAKEVKDVKLALALGGGGARGLSHLGVLQILDREGIRPDVIVGTSVGSIVGACYALHPDGLEVTRRGLAYLKSDAFSNNPFRKVLFNSEDVEQGFIRSWVMSIKKGYVFSSLLRKPSIFDGKKLYDLICDLVPDVTFDETEIPFAVPAIDIRSGEEVLITEGSLRTALLASCSLPGFFPPVEHMGMSLMDAGVISPVPVSACRTFEPKVLVAIDISNQLERVEKINIGLDAILRVEAIAGRRINDMELSDADVVIQPEVGNKVWSDFSDLDELVAEGLKAGKENINKVRELYYQKKFTRLWKSAGSV